jgi:hypothetical protein
MSPWLMAGSARVQPLREMVRGVATPRGEDSDVLHRHVQIATLSGLAGGDDDVFELMTAVLA